MGRSDPASVIISILKVFNNYEKLVRLLTSRRRVYLHYCPRCNIVFAITARPVRGSEDYVCGQKKIFKTCPLCGARLSINNIVVLSDNVLSNVYARLKELRDRIVEIHIELTKKCENYEGELREVEQVLKTIIEILEKKV